MSESRKHKVIVGLGQTGLSCARYLAARNESFIVVDDRTMPPALDELRECCPDVYVELGEFKESTLIEAKELIISPGVDLRTPPIQRSLAEGVPVSGDIDIFSREVEEPIVAVTGSNAKSTVVTLVGEMARDAGVDVAVAGNIGKPVLDVLGEGRHQLYVLELSSFQLETTDVLGAEVATVLNMSPDHFDRYDSMQDYYRAKHRIFRGCRQVVVNRDDALSSPLLPSHVKCWSFGLSVPEKNEFGIIEHQSQNFLAFGENTLMPVSEMKIAGRHNQANALASLAIGNAIGLPLDEMVKTLKQFSGLKHRCQWVAEIDGVSYYNDSKGTNVGACIAAIKGLGEKGRVILLAGGVGKGANFSPLAEPLKEYARLAILFGKDAEKIADAVRGSVDVLNASDLKHAVEMARDNAKPGDLVLMSPACASFDMFRNFEHRGETYMNIVREMH